MFANEFGKKVSVLRKNNMMTQQQLADKLKISNKTISRWETGEGYPDVSILSELAAILGTSVDYLLDNRDEVNMNNEDNVRISADEKTESKFKKKLKNLINKSTITILAIMIVHFVLWVILYAVNNWIDVPYVIALGLSYVGVIIWSVGPILSTFLAIGAIMVGIIETDKKQLIFGIVLLGISVATRFLMNAYFAMVIMY